MTGEGRAARQAALGLVNGVRCGGRMLTEQDLPDGLSPADRARAARLAVLCLAWSPRADRLIGPYIRQRPPEEALNILRLATVEMAEAGAPAHGVVDAAVDLARLAPETARLAGMVNAVLRRVARDLPKWPDLPLPTLPKWLRKRLLAAYGRGAVEAMEAAHLAWTPLDLTPRDGDAGALASELGGTVLPTGSVRLTGAPQVTALPGYSDGKWWVQDAAAALPARVLEPKAGERVLDLCAAPGGKTLQLAAAGAAVTALDISEARLGRLRENLARIGLEARVVAGDALTWVPDDPAAFDAVLLDAPCSATGTIRRHPDLPYVRTEAQIADLVALQAAMLDRAVALTRPGGRLVFCTCSLLPEEGEAHVPAALARHPGLRLDLPDDIPGVDPAWRGPEGLRLRPDFWPESGGMDGFFITRFAKDR